MNSSKRKRNDADGGGGGGGVGRGRGRGGGRGRGNPSNDAEGGRGRGGGRGGRGRGGRGRGNPADSHHFASAGNGEHRPGGIGGGGDGNRHRFGRVMPHPPKLKPHPSDPSRRRPTVSIAVPGSVVSNAQTRELQTQLAGQIARAAAVFRVDEIVVYDDGLGTELNAYSNYRRGPSTTTSAARSRPPPPPPPTAPTGDGDEEAKDGGGGGGGGGDGGGEEAESPTPRRERPRPSADPHAFLARILQYVECPQYLRKRLFPMHPDLQFAGLLPPLDAPHHLRRGDVSCYREGVVVADAPKPPSADEGGGYDGGDDGGGGSLVDCGVPNRLVRIDRPLPPGMRCTVRLDPKAYSQKSSSSSTKGGGGGVMEGTAVSPTAPRDDDGTYWGYATRLASSINAIFAECPYGGGYDLTVGTSERGDVSIDDPGFFLRKKKKKKTGGGGGEEKSRDNGGGGEVDGHGFDHMLIVFGGVAGIEESVDADESMTLPGEDSRKLFDVWVNVCPYQGSRTIRTEEALFITLARLSPFIARDGAPSGTTTQSKGGGGGGKNKGPMAKTEDVEFSDESVSEESSDEELIPKY